MVANKDDLTPRENEVLALAWQCFESEPKINMEKLAGLAGYTTGSAAFTMGKIKAKLRAKAAASTGNGVSKSAPTTPSKSSGGFRATPSKSRTTTPSKKRKTASPTKKHVSNDTDDDEEFDVKREAIKKEEVSDVLGAADGFLQGQSKRRYDGSFVEEDGDEEY